MTTILDQLRQPEYTGDNRCLPCTAVNSVLGIAVSGLAGIGTIVLIGSTLVAGIVMGLVFGVSAAAIWLRGYLIPGTPTLTKRYLPTRVLRWFGKSPTPDRSQDIDVESILLETKVVEPREEVDDLQLTSAFQRQLQTELTDFGTVDQAEILELIGVDNIDTEPEIDDRGNAVVLYADQRRIGQWPSRAALKADIAAGRVLQDWIDEWIRYHPADRAALLGGVRVFLEECPDGGGPVELRSETVESCCSEHEVAVIECSETGDRLLEQRVDQLVGPSED